MLILNLIPTFHVLFLCLCLYLWYLVLQFCLKVDKVHLSVSLLPYHPPSLPPTSTYALSWLSCSGPQSCLSYMLFEKVMWHGVDQGEQEGMGMLRQSLEAKYIAQGRTNTTVDLELTEHHLWEMCHHEQAHCDILCIIY